MTQVNAKTILSMLYIFAYPMILCNRSYYIISITEIDKDNKNWEVIMDYHELDAILDFWILDRII